MAEYVLVTKFYNERESLPELVASISSQTLKPKEFIFIDDGSVDESADVAAQEAERHGLNFTIVSMPKKQKGNLDTLGRAWNKAQSRIIEASEGCQFIAMTDVDTQFPPYYFERAIAFMNKNPKVGVVAGQVEEQPKRTFPMFTGKIVRAEIIRGIDKYWDISIDSFVNVKAIRGGYMLAILDELQVKAPVSHLQTKKGRFRAGRLAYYSGVGLLYATAKGVFKRDSQFLRGYWSEWGRGIWQAKDKDILEYYRGEFGRKLVGLTRKTLRL
ncbi:MAG: glycosyltransferase family 2 protein [Promethearchaeota archaeon]